MRAKWRGGGGDVDDAAVDVPIPCFGVEVKWELRRCGRPAGNADGGRGPRLCSLGSP